MQLTNAMTTARFFPSGRWQAGRAARLAGTARNLSLPLLDGAGGAGRQQRSAPPFAGAGA